MKSWPRWFPTPGAWAAALALTLLSGALAFGAGALATGAALVGKVSVRLAALLLLGAILSPVAATAFAHHLMVRLLDWLAPGSRASRAPFGSASRGMFPGLLSWWAGAYSWFVIVMAAILTAFTFAIIDPPSYPRLPGALQSMPAAMGMAPTPGAAVRLLTVPGLVWLVYAAYLFHFSGLVERRLRSGA